MRGIPSARVVVRRSVDEGPQTAAVEIALDYYLKHHENEEKTATTRQETARILDELAALPILDDRDADEILGYDKDGLA